MDRNKIRISVNLVKKDWLEYAGDVIYPNYALENIFRSKTTANQSFC